MNDNLIIKYLNGETSAEENIQIMKWIDEKPENLKEFKAFRKLHDLETWNPEIIPPVEKSSHWKFPNYVLECIKIAAIFIITLAGLQFYNKYTQDETWQTIISPLGQRTEVYLSDGTQVWLNSQTKLTYPTSFKEKSRKVKLEGEAYFKVAKDKNYPFIVNAKNYDIKVLGTEFNVHAYPGDGIFKTSLIEGKVNICSEKTGESLYLTPNMQAITENGKLVVSRIKSTSSFLWREGIISFDDNTLDELAQKLENYFNVNIIIENQANKKIKYTGKFRINDGIHHILRTLELRKEFTYTYNEKNNMIKIK